jgi:hypothetical protein
MPIPLSLPEYRQLLKHRNLLGQVKGIAKELGNFLLYIVS